MVQRITVLNGGGPLRITNPGLLLEINADVRSGTKRDAVLFGIGSNSEHGLPRTDADKLHIVNLLLNDEEWVKWSNREIARRCKVSHKFVNGVRKAKQNQHDASLEPGSSEKTERIYTAKQGTKATMKTGNIGRNKPAQKHNQTMLVHLKGVSDQIILYFLTRSLYDLLTNLQQFIPDEGVCHEACFSYFYNFIQRQCNSVSKLLHQRLPAISGWLCYKHTDCLPFPN